MRYTCKDFLNWWWELDPWWKMWNTESTQLLFCISSVQKNTVLVRACVQVLGSASPSQRGCSSGAPGVLLTFLSAICWHLLCYLCRTHNLWFSERLFRDLTSSPLCFCETEAHRRAVLKRSWPVSPCRLWLWAPVLLWWKSITRSTGLRFARSKVEHTEDENVEGWRAFL